MPTYVKRLQPPKVTEVSVFPGMRVVCQRASDPVLGYHLFALPLAAIEVKLAELQQVAEYVAFLRFRARVVPLPVVDPTHLASLYAEFADEDRMLAEEGLDEYHAQLHAEDTQ